MFSEEKTISSREIFNGRVVKLYVDEVELDNGNKATREYVKHPGGVCVLPIDDDGNVYMVKQFRYPFKAALYEIPAGKLEYGEDHRQCGIRELREETGAEAGRFEYLGCIYPTVAYDTEIIHMYLARELSFGEQELDDGEFLDVIKLPFDEVFAMAMRGELPDAKTLAAVLKARFLLQEEK